MSRVFLWGTSVGVGAALVYWLFDGLLAAAALVILVFSVLITVGLLIGLALERSPRHGLGMIVRSIRTTLTGRRSDDLCRTCHRPTVEIRSMRVCPACDLIAVAT